MFFINCFRKQIYVLSMYFSNHPEKQEFSGVLDGKSRHGQPAVSNRRKF